MIEEDVKKGLYDLKDLKKYLTTIGGKKLYTMSYKKWPGGIWEKLQNKLCSSYISLLIL